MHLTTVVVHLGLVYRRSVACEYLGGCCRISRVTQVAFVEGLEPHSFACDSLPGMGAKKRRTGSAQSVGGASSCVSIGAPSRATAARKVRTPSRSPPASSVAGSQSGLISEEMKAYKKEPDSAAKYIKLLPHVKVLAGAQLGVWYRFADKYFQTLDGTPDLVHDFLLC